MNRERALKVVLVLVGLLFSAGIYPLTMFLWSEAAVAMMLSVYVTLGIFLLIAARNPSANRNLIAFTAWSSLAHAAVMAVQASRNVIARGELLGVAALHPNNPVNERNGDIMPSDKECFRFVEAGPGHILRHCSKGSPG
jgi:hypothetical protein